MNIFNAKNLDPRHFYIFRNSEYSHQINSVLIKLIWAYKSFFTLDFNWNMLDIILLDVGQIIYITCFSLFIFKYKNIFFWIFLFWVVVLSFWGEAVVRYKIFHPKFNKDWVNKYSFKNYYWLETVQADKFLLARPPKN